MEHFAKLQKKNLILKIITGVLLISLSISLWYLYSIINNKSDAESINAKTNVASKAQKDTNEIKKQSKQNNPIEIEVNNSSKSNNDYMSQGIDIPGYPEISLKEDSKDMFVELENPKGNPCYLKYNLILKDTGQSIYQSKFIKPGNVINKQVLSNSLKKGKHYAYFQITTVSLDEAHTPMNGANVATEIIVK